MINGRIKRRPSTKRLGLPRIGNIRIGYKTKSRTGKEIPCSTDYFIPVGKYASLFTKVYGDKPASIQIMFIDDDDLSSCDERYEYRDDAGHLISYGDGDTFSVWTGEEYKEFSSQDYPDIMERIKRKYPTRRNEWKVLLTLRFMIPTIEGILGLWQFSTCGNESSIPNILVTYDEVKKGNGGKIAGILFDLNVKFVKSQKPGVSSHYPVVSLVPNMSQDNRNKVAGNLQSFTHIKQLGNE